MKILLKKSFVKIKSADEVNARKEKLIDLLKAMNLEELDHEYLATVAEKELIFSNLEALQLVVKAIRTSIRNTYIKMLKEVECISCHCQITNRMRISRDTTIEVSERERYWELLKLNQLYAERKSREAYMLRQENFSLDQDNRRLYRNNRDDDDDDDYYYR